MPHTHHWLLRFSVATLFAGSVWGCPQQTSPTQLGVQQSSRGSAKRTVALVQATPSLSPPQVGTIDAGATPNTGATDPTSTATPAVTPTATPAVTPTATPAVTPTATPAVTPTATPAVTPTATPAVTPTATPAVTPTATPPEPIIYSAEAYRIVSVVGGQLVGNPTDLQTGDGAAIGNNPEGVGMTLDPSPVVIPPLVPLVHFSDSDNATVRTVDTGSLAVTWGGIGAPEEATPTLRQPRGMVFDPVRKVIYVADSFNHRIIRIGRTGNTEGLDPGQFDVIAGRIDTPNDAPYADGAGASATLHTPTGLALTDSSLYFSDAGFHSIRRIDLSAPTFPVSFVAGGKSTQGGPAAASEVTAEAARFDNPTAITGALRGGVPTLVVADTFNHCLRTVNPLTGAVGLLAGSSAKEPGSADGTATAARFQRPRALAADGAGRIFVGEQETPRLREVGVDGQVRTLIGAQQKGYVNAESGNARVGAITGMAVRLDLAGQLVGLYVYDVGTAENAPRIRLVEPVP